MISPGDLLLVAKDTGKRTPLVRNEKWYRVMPLHAPRLHHSNPYVKQVSSRDGSETDLGCVPDANLDVSQS